MNWFQIAFVCCVSLLLVLGTGMPPSSSSLTTSKTYPSGYDPHGGYVDRLTFIVYPSEDIATALLALQSGQIYSYDVGIPYQSIVELVGNPAVEVSSEPGMSYRQFSIDCWRFPTNLTGYRRALAYALDKYAVVANARGGFAQVMDNAIPLAYQFWTYENQMTAHYYNEDIVSANATLDATHIIDTPDSPHPGWRYYDVDRSGNWTEGVDWPGDEYAPFGLKMELCASEGYDPAIQACIVLQTGMEKCGLQSEVVEVNFNVIGVDIELPQFCCFSGSIPPPGTPTLLYDYFHTSGINNHFFYHYNNSDYDQNCTMFMNAPTRLEARNWAWNCCKILLEDMPMIVCYNDEATQAYRTDIWEGYIPQIGVNRMGGNPYTYQQLRLMEAAGGPWGCFPIEYVTVLTDGMSTTNAIDWSPNDQGTATIMRLLYSSLLRVDPLDPSTGLAPDLAYNWYLNLTTASGDIQDGVRYTIDLYENVTWHDGIPFTAEDVAYSLMTIHPWGPYTADNVAHIYRVDTPDNKTVEIYLNSTAYVDFTKFTSLLILPRHIWNPYEAENFTWTPATPEDLTGTGCYKWIVRVPDLYVILDHHRDWHFNVEQPDRIPCVGDGNPPIWVLVAVLVIVIIIEVVLLGYLLYQRKQKQEVKTK